MWSQKSVFWQAFISAAFVFGLGILIGYMIENYRTSKMSDIFAQSELDLLDARTQNEIYKLEQIDCNSAINENIKFADRVYEEAKLLDKYKQANKMTETIVREHKKYDMLRTLFWLNSVSIKQRCNATYHNIVYLYQFKNPRLDQKAKQSVMSNILKELKEKEGNSIMLIPIAADNNITSVDLLLSIHKIDKENLPVILIDEKIKIYDIETVEQIEQQL